MGVDAARSRRAQILAAGLRRNRVIELKHDTPCSRRAFLRVGAAAATAALGACREVSGTRGLRVAIVGAGLAGLESARRLLGGGHDVTIFEARSEAGGRVRTERDRFPDGLHADTGATWFPSTHRRLMSLCRELEVRLVPVRTGDELRRLRYRYFVRGTSVDVGKGMVCRRQGRQVSFPYRLSEAEQEAPLELATRYVHPRAMKVRAALESGRALSDFADLDRMTFADFLRSEGASEEAIAFLRLGLFDDWGDGADHVSALCVLRDVSRLPGPGTEPIFVAKEGADRLPKAMAKELETRIRYETAVRRVTRDSGGATLAVERGGRSEETRFDRVVIALPHRVLADLDIAPELSPAKVRALKAIPSTSIARVFLQVRERHWRKLGFWGDSITDLPMQAVIDATMRQDGARGFLNTYTAADAARALALKSEAERIRAAQQHVETIFPGIEDSIEDGFSVLWDEEPWARGAFAWFRPGQLLEHGEALAAADGNLHFAGEYASEHPGWMEGALESAERVADEIGNRRKG